MRPTNAIVSGSYGFVGRVRSSRCRRRSETSRSATPVPIALERLPLGARRRRAQVEAAREALLLALELASFERVARATAETACSARTRATSASPCRRNRGSSGRRVTCATYCATDEQCTKIRSKRCAASSAPHAPRQSRRIEVADRRRRRRRQARDHARDLHRRVAPAPSRMRAQCAASPAPSLASSRRARERRDVHLVLRATGAGSC